MAELAISTIQFNPSLNCSWLMEAERGCVGSEFQTVVAAKWKLRRRDESWSDEPACHDVQPNGDVLESDVRRRNADVFEVGRTSAADVCTVSVDSRTRNHFVTLPSSYIHVTMLFATGIIITKSADKLYLMRNDRKSITITGDGKYASRVNS